MLSYVGQSREGEKRTLEPERVALLLEPQPLLDVERVRKDDRFRLRVHAELLVDLLRARREDVRVTRVLAQSCPLAREVRVRDEVLAFKHTVSTRERGWVEKET